MPNRNVSNLNDSKALVRGCIKGDRLMQSLLYHRYAPQMKGVCMRYARNSFEAEEILQEGFIQVFECLSQYRFQSPLQYWIRKIMINCALQKLRLKTILYPVFDCEEWSTECIKADTVTSGLHTKELIAMVQSLPLMCRLVFNLYVFEGMKHREIGTLLDISEGTSKSHLFDARKMLQQQLKAADAMVRVNA
ncbi:MAG: RNA polymerase subunit sigma-24 [Bacteroidetes bacterium]|nr:MAG: RNA polymerase subunit sigma-24 [Bacteroidota bacterium]